jgi:hypothetical protein
VAGGQIKVSSSGHEYNYQAALLPQQLEAAVAGEGGQQQA